MPDLTIAASTLSTAMAFAARVTEPRNTIPIIANVCLKASGGTLTITTTDLDNWFSQPIAADGDMDATVDSIRFAAIITACSGRVTLSLDNNRMTIKSGRSRWQLPSLPSSDFPFMVPDGLCKPVKLVGSALASAIGRISSAITVSQSRPYLGGAFLDGEGGKLRMTATDGQRCVVCEPGAAWPKDAATVIVPVKLLKLLAAIAATMEGEVSLSWSDTKFQAILGDVTLTGKLIDGQFPDYRRIIPAPVNAPVMFDPDALRQALRRVALVESEKTRVVKLDIADGRVAVSISANSGEGNEEVPASFENDARVGFNVTYLAEMLESIGGETVEMHLAQEKKVALFRPAVANGAFGFLGTFQI